MVLVRALLNTLMVALTTIFGSFVAFGMRAVDSSGDLVLSLARWWSTIITRLAGVDIRVDCRARLEKGQPYVFMANHLSAADIWSLFVAIPIPLRMIAKKQLARIPLFGWAMWAGRFIFIDRHNATAARESIELAKRRIRGGEAVLLFPEGTRSRDGTVGPFKKGGFHLAIDAGAPIVPVAIWGTRELMPRKSLLLRSGPVYITIGEPIPTAGITGEERHLMVERVRGRIVAMLAEQCASGVRGVDPGVAPGTADVRP